MNLDELEKHLDKGEQWGVRKATDSPDYLGWILIRKKKAAYALASRYI